MLSARVLSKAHHSPPHLNLSAKHVQGLSNETTFGVCQFVEAARRLGVPPPITIQNDFCLMDRR